MTMVTLLPICHEMYENKINAETLTSKMKVDVKEKNLICAIRLEMSVSISVSFFQNFSYQVT